MLSHRNDTLTYPVARSLLVAVCLALAAACGNRELQADREALAAAAPELLSKLRADPYNYFRFVNHEWTSRVCEVFASDLATQPTVQLHGDAHLEQYAFTNSAWGLDDFDDSTRGPALVDIIRFLGSIDLAVRRRGWTHERQSLFDRFIAGYRQGLSDPLNQPPRPGIIDRLQLQHATPTNRAFLAWAETQMEPLSETATKGVRSAMVVFAQIVQQQRPDLPDAYFRIVRAGWLHMGIGSANAKKVLIRVDGASAGPEDDVVLEAKAIRALADVRCLEVPRARPTFRVITGNQQLGRLKHDILVAGPEVPIPELTGEGPNLGDWWIRSWEPSYREVGLDDFGSVEELSAIVYDSGSQLGAGSIHLPGAVVDAALQQHSLAALGTVDARVRREAVNLVEQMLRGWDQLTVTQGFTRAK
jgi:Uncharacterized protein conserved in bacteria (DUF2252)